MTGAIFIVWNLHSALKHSETGQGFPKPGRVVTPGEGESGRETVPRRGRPAAEADVASL